MSAVIDVWLALETLCSLAISPSNDCNHYMFCAKTPVISSPTLFKSGRTQCWYYHVDCEGEITCPCCCQHDRKPVACSLSSMVNSSRAVLSAQPTPAEKEVLTDALQRCAITMPLQEPMLVACIHASNLSVCHSHVLSSSRQSFSTHRKRGALPWQGESEPLVYIHGLASTTFQIPCPPHTCISSPIIFSWSASSILCPLSSALYHLPSTICPPWCDERVVLVGPYAGRDFPLGDT